MWEGEAGAVASGRKYLEIYSCFEYPVLHFMPATGIYPSYFPAYHCNDLLLNFSYLLLTEMHLACSDLARDKEPICQGRWSKPFKADLVGVYECAQILCTTCTGQGGAQALEVRAWPESEGLQQT